MNVFQPKYAIPGEAHKPSTREHNFHLTSRMDVTSLHVTTIFPLTQTPFVISSLKECVDISEVIKKINQFKVWAIALGMGDLSDCI